MDEYINEYREKVREHLVGIGIDQNELIDDFSEERNFLQTLDKQRASDLIALAHQTCSINLSRKQKRINEHYGNLICNDSYIREYYGNTREVSKLINPTYPLDYQGKDSQYWVKWLTQHQEKLFILQKCINCVEQDSKKTKRINWLKSEKTLRKLIDALKSNALIEQKETEDIIQHFEVPGKESKQTKLEPINWLKSRALLAYLIEALTTKPERHESFMDSQNKWKLLQLHFVIKGNEISRSLVTDIGQSRYPNGSDDVDTILKRLT